MTNDTGWIGVAGWYHLAAFGVLIPWAVLRGRAKLATRPLPPLRRHLPKVLIQLALFAAFSVVVARLEWVPLLPARRPPLWTAALGVAFALAAAAAMRPLWRQAVALRKRITFLFMPRDGTERALWIAVSIAAGISEEITWRGVQWTILSRALGNLWIAALVCAAMFAAAHGIQGGRSMGIIFLLSLGFHGLVALSGSLVVAMAAHALYDVIAGLTYGRLGERLGYPRDPAELGPAPAPPAAPDAATA